MANIQIKDLPPVTTIAELDVFHINQQATSGDRSITFTAFSDFFITENKATNTEAIGGTSDTSLMTPLKTASYINARIASVAEAQDPNNDTNLMTPSKVKTLLEASPATTTTAPTAVSGGGTLELYKFYVITDSDTYTLPDVTAFTGEEYLRVVRLEGQTPILQREGSNSEVILINGTFTDSAMIMDLGIEFVPVYNDTTNTWEI